MQRAAIRERVMRRAPWILFALFFAVEAWARVGGGESYSGGGSSGGGSSGDGDGGAELLFFILRFLFWLTIEHPVVGIPVDIVVVAGVVMWLRRKPNLTALRVSTSHEDVAPRVSIARLDALQKFDPNFSEITFSDFCYSLYARAHHARGAGDIDRYAPYLSPAARQALRTRNPRGLREVRGVVIGAFQITALRGMDTPTVGVTVNFESNYTEVTESENSYYVREQWILERRRDILSPPPEKAKADHCPRCGAALQTRTDGACQYCGVKIDSGAFQWYVRAVTSVSVETRGPLLTSNVPERGTELATRFQHHFGQRRNAFEAEHAGFDWGVFLERVRKIAVELQDAWTARDWERVRPLETDSLFQMHRYWIDAYLRQRLRNVVADYRIGRIEPVKITSDAFYEAITVRMFAQGRDFTSDESGRVVAGSDRDVRSWSEYWTLIRSRGAERGAQNVSCPNCGARVTVGATGICEFCGGKLTAGEFDWVLSRIEQDEAFVA